MNQRILVFLVMGMFLFSLPLQGQTFLLGGGMDLSLKEKQSGEYLINYNFPDKTTRYLLLPAVEFGHFGLVLPCYYSSQAFSYRVYEDHRYGNPYLAYPNRHVILTNNSYDGNYACGGMGILPYLVVGKKVKFTAGVGLMGERYVMTSKRVYGSIEKFHYDSSAVKVRDSYMEYDSLQPDSYMGTDLVMVYQLGLQVEITENIRISAAMQFRKSEWLNSLAVYHKQSFALSLGVFYVWPDKRSRKE